MEHSSESDFAVQTQAGRSAHKPTSQLDGLWWPLTGVALLLFGLAVLMVYWFLYDTTVTEYTGGGWSEERRVNDLGRVSDRLAGMIGGGVISIIGVLLCQRFFASPITSHERGGR